MAITKTATRDLTTAIAGAIWNRIKDADDERLGQDPAVTKAKRELEKEDPNATKVEDKPLREQISKIFGNLNLKVMQTETKVDSLSGKVTAVAGEVVNTQQLIINQNEILAEKFDTLLEVLTGQKADAVKKADDDEFKQLELDLEQKKEGGAGGSFGISKGSVGKGSYSGLVNWFRVRFGEWISKRLRGLWKARWVRNLTKKPRAYAKLMRGRLKKKIYKSLAKHAGSNMMPRLLKGPGAKKAISIALGRGAGRMIPVASSVLAADDVARYSKKGDWLGMALASIDMVASGTEAAYGTGVGAPVGAVASLIANIAGWGLTAYEIGQILLGGDPYSTKGVLPFETGTKLQPAQAGTVSSITPIVSVVRAFGQQSGYGKQVEAAIAAAGVGDVPSMDVSHSFSVGGTSSTAGLAQGTGSSETDTGEVPDEIKRRLDRNREQEEQALRDANEERGTGGDPVTATDRLMGGKKTTIEFHGQQGRDLSGEPGVDFSYSDYKSNYNLFPGYVLETGLLYGERYGNVVVVRSIDPSNGKEFDSLYSHFPNGGIAVKKNQKVGAGHYLGKVGFVSVDTPGVPQMQPHNAGNMSGWHTSVDFFEPGSATRYSNADNLIKLVISANGQTPHGLLNKLKPVDVTPDSTNSDVAPPLPPISSLNSIDSPLPNLVSEGSMNRQMMVKMGRKGSSIVIINNQVISNNTTQISGGRSSGSDNFFEAYTLARLG